MATIFFSKTAARGTTHTNLNELGVHAFIRLNLNLHVNVRGNEKSD